MNSLVTILRNTVIYFFGSVFSKVIGVLMVPLYTHYLTPADFGYYDLALTYISIVMTLVFLNLGTTSLRFLLNETSSVLNKNVLSNIFIVFFICVCIYSLGMGIFYLFCPFKYAWLIYLYGLSGMLADVFSSCARAAGKNGLYVTAGAVASISNATTAAVLLLMGFQASCLFVGLIVAAVIKIVLIEWILHPLRSCSWNLLDIKVIYQLLCFSVPLGLNGVSYWLCSSFGKVVLVSKLGVSANGLYAIAGKFGMSIALAGSCFSLAWQEMSYRKTSQGDNTHFFIKAFDFYIKCTIACYILIIPAILIVFPFLVSAEYSDAKLFIPLYMMWVMLDMITHFLGNIITGFKKTTNIFITTMAGSIVSVCCLYLLIPVMGIQGANLALVFGFITTGILRYQFLKKLILFRINFKSILLMLPLVLLISSGRFPLHICFLGAVCVCVGLYLLPELSYLYQSVKKKIFPVINRE